MMNYLKNYVVNLNDQVYQRSKAFDGDGQLSLKNTLFQFGFHIQSNSKLLLTLMISGFFSSNEHKKIKKEYKNGQKQVFSRLNDVDRNNYDLDYGRMAVNLWWAFLLLYSLSSITWRKSIEKEWKQSMRTENQFYYEPT